VNPPRTSPRPVLWAGLAVVLLSCAVPAARADWPTPPEPDTLRFDPRPPDAETGRDEDDRDEDGRHYGPAYEDRWLRAPFGDNLLTDPDAWRAREDDSRFHLLADYNRVDRLRLGLGLEVQHPEAMHPRIGLRIEQAFDRKRTLFGAQIEQPLAPPGRLALGVSMVRRTDHSELQQVEDLENSLALLFGRQDYRDYFEREGYGVYLSWRVPDFSTVSVHARSDDYRSVPLNEHTRSWFQRDRDLRPNPAIDDGEVRSVVVRLERLARRTYRTRAGLYHWIEFQRAGRGMGGDFDFTRMLADVRSVIRLSPASTLSLRGVVGGTFDGTLPAQKQFTAGGVDGLRAHAFATYRGNQMLLGQAEYAAGLWPVRSAYFDGGLYVIAFVDVGRAWFAPEEQWDVDRQHMETDAGLGLATSDDGLRLYFAKNLREPESDLVISLRLQRPF